MPEKHFSAILTPNRSLGPTGFIFLMGLVCAVSFVAGVIFLSLGAWPVTGFFGLDALLIYGAFKLNYHSGKQKEVIEINGEELKVMSISPNGQVKTSCFNRYWVRVEHHLTAEEEYENPPVILTSHGRSLEIASFLSRAEKSKFVELLHTALLPR